MYYLISTEIFGKKNVFDESLVINYWTCFSRKEIIIKNLGKEKISTIECNSIVICSYQNKLTQVQINFD